MICFYQGVRETLLITVATASKWVCRITDDSDEPSEESVASILPENVAMLTEHHIASASSLGDWRVWIPYCPE